MKMTIKKGLFVSLVSIALFTGFTSVLTAPWKTITIGGTSFDQYKIQAKDSNTWILPDAEEVLQSIKLSANDSGRSIELYSLSPNDLGLDLVKIDYGNNFGGRWALPKDIFARAAEMGFEPCPVEAGLILANQLKFGKNDGYVFLMTNPVPKVHFDGLFLIDGHSDEYQHFQSIQTWNVRQYHPWLRHPAPWVNIRRKVFWISEFFCHYDPKERFIFCKKK